MFHYEDEMLKSFMACVFMLFILLVLLTFSLFIDHITLTPEKICATSLNSNTPFCAELMTDIFVFGSNFHGNALFTLQ